MRYSAVEMIEKLVGFPTVSRDSNLDLIEFVREYLAEHGVESHVVPNPEGTKGNLYATVGPAVEAAWCSPAIPTSSRWTVSRGTPIRSR